jgi:hypothetical protein
VPIASSAQTRSAVRTSPRGVEVGEVCHEGAPGARLHDSRHVLGPAREHGTSGSFAAFSDPDGN